MSWVYTAAEIDRMREAIKARTPNNSPQMGRSSDFIMAGLAYSSMVEDRLRTAIAGSVHPNDLIDETTKWAEKIIAQPETLWNGNRVYDSERDAAEHWLRNHSKKES